MRRRGVGKGLIGLAAAALAAASPALAQEEQGLQSSAAALEQDARQYAERYGVGLDEAMARLRAQEETVPLTDAIAEEFSGRLAGISVQHRPDYRIVVLLTGKGRVRERRANVAGLRVAIVFRTGAAATREAVVAAIVSHQAAIRASLQVAPGMGLDPRTGELVVVVHAADLARETAAALDSRLEALTGVPVRIRPQGQEQRNLVAGGARVEGPDSAGTRKLACTTGFVLTDGARTAIATAAHCPDALSYRESDGREVPLDFVGQWGWSFRDVQIHATDLAQRPLFYADPEKKAARRLTGRRGRAGTRAGDSVCHRGETTGYSCSEVQLVDYAPPGDLCGGPCAPAWTTVSGPSCKGGDSGGPVFNGSIAYGLLKGASYARSGRCDFYYYMSTDYLPEGWSLLH